MRSCPICSETMNGQSIHGVKVEICEAHGIWLDKGELYLVTEGERHEKPEFLWADLFRREQRPPVDRDRQLDCPVCGEGMEIEKHHGVHIDWCREHGVWLDNGELDAIMNNLRLDPLFVGKVATRLWETRF